MDEIISKRLSMNVRDEEFIKNLEKLYDDNKVYLDAMLGVNRNFHFEKRVKEYAKFILAETNMKVNDVYFSYIWEYRFNGMFSLFRLWIQRNKEISIEEFLKLVKKLYY